MEKLKKYINSKNEYNNNNNNNNNNNDYNISHNGDEIK